MTSDERWLEQRLRAEIAGLAIPPRERWFPPARRTPAVAPALALTTLVVLIALATGVALRTVREDRLPAATASAPNPAATVASPIASPSASEPATSTSRLSRQSALALIRTRWELLRILRIEAKLVERGDAARIDSNGVAELPNSESFWVIAVLGAPGGDSRTGPLRSALYVMAADSGETVERAGSLWPEAFDSLVDRAVSASAISLNARVISVDLPNRLTLETLGTPVLPPGTRLTARTSDDTAYSWTAGLMGGPAYSLEEMFRYLPPGMLVTVQLEPSADGSYRLASIVNVTR